MFRVCSFSVPQIEYPLGGSSEKGSHVNILLIVAMVLLLWCQIVLLWHQVTMVAWEQHLYQTIVLPKKLSTGNIHDYLFCYCPLVGILFEVLRIMALLSFLTINTLLLLDKYLNFLLLISTIDMLSVHIEELKWPTQDMHKSWNLYHRTCSFTMCMLTV